MKNGYTKLIAEIGINHNGSLDVAKKLIDVAKVAGCDFVKFQKRTPDICVPEHQKNKIIFFCLVLLLQAIILTE